MGVIRMVRNMLFSPLRRAIKRGLIAEEGVTVMEGVSFGSEPYLIRLRKNCRISMRVTFITHDGGTWAFRHEKRYSSVIKYGLMDIGEYSFIGANAIIMPGVSIGCNCIIGADSVVTKSIPDGMVAAGVPAKILCTTFEYAGKCLAQMPTDFDENAYLKDKREYLIKKFRLHNGGEK